MYQKFLKLKEEKSWLFYLLIIPFLIVSGLEFYNRYLVNSGKQIIKNTEKKDEDLKNKQNKLEAGAKYHEEKAVEIEKQIENKNINEDWHKK